MIANEFDRSSHTSNRMDVVHSERARTACRQRSTAATKRSYDTSPRSVAQQRSELWRTTGELKLGL